MTKGELRSKIFKTEVDLQTLHSAISHMNPKDEWFGHYKLAITLKKQELVELNERMCKVVEREFFYPTELTKEAK